MSFNATWLLSLQEMIGIQTQRKNHMKTQREDSLLQAKERGFRMKPPLLTP